MQEKKLTEEQKRIWTLAALTAPLAHTAAGIPWPGVLAAVLLSAGIRGLFSGNQKSGTLCRVLNRLTFLWAGALCLSGMQNCWPGQQGAEWIPGIFLLLAVWTGRKGRDQAGQAAAVLWWAVAFLFGSVLLSAVPEGNPGNLIPRRISGKWEQWAVLLGILLLPEPWSRGERRKQGDWALGLEALLFSLCSQGVLTANTMQQEPAPFYTLSRSIAFYGVFQRMEALAWLGLMLGTFLCLAYLTEGAVDRQQHPGIVPGLLSAAGMGILYGLGAGRSGELLTGWMILSGYVLPDLEGIFSRKRKWEKFENNG